MPLYVHAMQVCTFINQHTYILVLNDVFKYMEDLHQLTDPWTPNKHCQGPRISESEEDAGLLASAMSWGPGHAATGTGQSCFCRCHVCLIWFKSAFANIPKVKEHHWPTQVERTCANCNLPRNHANPCGNIWNIHTHMHTCTLNNFYFIIHMKVIGVLALISQQKDYPK